MRMCVGVVATLAIVGVAVGAGTAQAQQDAAHPPKKHGGIIGALDRIDKAICGQDGSKCAPAGGSAAATARPATKGDGGARVQVVSAAIEGDSTTGAAFEVGDKAGVKRVRRACGTERTCVAGWDLRLLEIRLPADTLPGGATIPVTYVIENRGMTASRLSEIQVCYSSEYDTRGTCGERVEQFDLPALGAGESAEVTRPLRLKPFGSTGAFRLAAIIDPDNASGEANRTNNSAASRPLTLDAPQLQWMAFQVPESATPGRDIVIDIRVRNRSFVATSPATELGWGTNYWGHKPEYRMTLPALAPRQAYTARVRVSTPPQLSAGNISGFGVRVDPDQKLVWGNAHEREKQATIRVIGQ